MFEHVSEVLTYTFKRNLSDCSKTPIEWSPLSFLQVLDTYIKILDEVIEFAKSSLETIHVVAVGVIEKTSVTNLVKASKSSKYRVELWSKNSGAVIEVDAGEFVKRDFTSDGCGWWWWVGTDSLD